MQSLLNYCKETLKNRLLCDGWKKITTKHMTVTAFGGNISGLNAQAATVARIIVVVLIGRPKVNVYHQDSLIHLKINLT